MHNSETGGLHVYRACGKAWVATDICVGISSGAMLYTGPLICCLCFLDVLFPIAGSAYPGLDSGRDIKLILPCETYKNTSEVQT